MTFQIPVTMRLAALIMALAAGTATAQEKIGHDAPEIPDPIITEEVHPTTFGEWELRWTSEYIKHDGVVTTTLPQFQLFYGLLPRLGLEVNIPLLYRREEARVYGLGDSSSSLKWLLREQSPNIPAIVVGAEFGFPTGNSKKEMGEGRYEIEPFFGLVKNVLGFRLQGTMGRSSYSGAVGVPLRQGKLYAFGEIKSFQEVHGRSVAAGPGIKYQFRKDATIGVGFPVQAGPAKTRSVVTQLQIGF